jgi:protein N-terminal methyltransferase
MKTTKQFVGRLLNFFTTIDAVTKQHDTTNERVQVRDISEQKFFRKKKKKKKKKSCKQGKHPHQKLIRLLASFSAPHTQLDRSENLLFCMYCNLRMMVREKKPKPKNKTKKKKAKTGPKKEPGPFECIGFTSTEPPRVFKSLAALWDAFPADQWYPTGASYWQKTSADENGMLGGLLELKAPDESESLALLRDLQATQGLGNKRACDVGGGIGRVSRNVLTKVFEKVDLVEQNSAFLDQAAKDLPDVTRVCCGLQDFVPAEGEYDVIWTQWVTGHLRDEHFVPFVERMLKGLNPHGGVLVIKDNTASGDEFVMDCDDHSLTRTFAHYQSIFKQASKSCGAKVLSCTRQKGFPEGVFPVYTWVISKSN